MDADESEELVPSDFAAVSDDGASLPLLFDPDFALDERLSVE
ncbi:MAG TPA: hypothetical protein VKA06_05640 [Spirochaetia bacterium]|nr:hypothetical protein [Spirochaetia bacterium]